MEDLQNSPWGALEAVSEETHLAMWPRIETRLMRTRLDRALPWSSVVAGAGKELASPSVRKQPTSDSPLRRELPREVAQCGLNFLVTLWPIVWAHTGRTISTRRLQSAHLSGAAVCFLCPHPFSLTPYKLMSSAPIKITIAQMAAHRTAAPTVAI